MDFVTIYLIFSVGLMIYAVIVLIGDGIAKHSYGQQMGRRVTYKEWRAYKNGLKAANKRMKIEEKQVKKNKAQVGKRVPVKTKILDHSSGALHGGGGGVGRAIIGGAVAGSVGAVVGASTRKQKFTQDQYTMFKVWYSDGSTEVEKVLHKATKYKKYLELLED